MKCLMEVRGESASGESQKTKMKENSNTSTTLTDIDNNYEEGR